MNKTYHEKFLYRIRIDETTGCHVWIGANRGPKRSLRPAFCVNGKNENAYRWLWQQERGILTKDQDLCHTCDNTLCVNLDHLWIGNDKSNQADMRAKGRAKYPTEMNHGHRKLDLDIVKHIRFLYSTGEYTTRQLGETYNVDSKTVHALVIGKTWKSAGGPIASVEKGHANCKGSNNPNSKLLDEDIENIIKCKRLGQTNSSLAEEYNVHFSSIQRIKYK